MKKMKKIHIWGSRHVTSQALPFMVVVVEQKKNQGLKHVHILCPIPNPNHVGGGGGGGGGGHSCWPVVMVVVSVCHHHLHCHVLCMKKERKTHLKPK